jgi:hypothetical protein
MRIPDQFRDRMRSAGEAAAKTGTKLAVDFLKEAKAAVAGVYMMPPFRKYHVIDELLTALG